jgi:hypothetical protein
MNAKSVVYVEEELGRFYRRNATNMANQKHGKWRGNEYSKHPIGYGCAEGGGGAK